MKILLLCCVLMFPVFAGFAEVVQDILEMPPGPDEPGVVSPPYEGAPVADTETAVPVVPEIRELTLTFSANGIDYVYDRRSVAWTSENAAIHAAVRDTAASLGLEKSSLIPLKLGESIVFFEQVISEKPGLTYLFVHPNELAAYHATKEHVLVHGGTALLYIDRGAPEEERLRFMELKHEGVRYALDPNRVFAEGEVFKEEFLRIGRFSRHYWANSPWYYENFGAAVKAQVQVFTGFVDMLIEGIQGPVIVVHHNNKRMWWAKNIFDGTDTSGTAAASFISDNWPWYDFCYVTHQDTYRQLAERGINAILQDNIHVPLDGSLSVHLRNSVKPYICVEIGGWDDGELRVWAGRILLEEIVSIFQHPFFLDRDKPVLAESHDNAVNFPPGAGK